MADGHNSIIQIPGCFDRLTNVEGANEWNDWKTAQISIFVLEKNDLISKLFWATRKLDALLPKKT